MEEHEHRLISVDDTRHETVREISLLEIASVLLRYRRMLIFLPLLLGGVMAALAMTQERTYSASAAFMPQGATSPAGPAAALARQFGVDVGGQQPGRSPQFYIQLLRGREILQKTTESEFIVPAEDARTRSATLVDFWNVGSGGVVPQWQRAVDHLRSKLTTEVDPATGIIEIRVSAETPELAEQIVARLLELVNEFNLETRQSQAKEEARFVAGRLEEAAAGLASAESTLQRFLRENRQFRTSPDLLFAHERLQRQVAIRQQLYSSLLLSHEQARIDGVRDTPVITTVEEPEGSGVPDGRGTIARTILGVLGGLLLAIFLAFGRELARRSRQQHGDQYHEFDRLKGEAVRDLRNPFRLFRPGSRGGSRAAL